MSPTLLNASNNNLGVVFGVGVVNCDVEVVVLLLSCMMILSTLCLCLCLRLMSNGVDVYDYVVR